MYQMMMSGKDFLNRTAKTDETERKGRSQW